MEVAMLGEDPIVELERDGHVRGRDGLPDQYPAIGVDQAGKVVGWHNHFVTLGTNSAEKAGNGAKKSKKK